MDCSEMTQDISQHISANLSNYFPQLTGTDADVRLIDEQHRASSSLYRFEVVNHLAHHKLFAKGVFVAKDPAHEAHRRADSRPRVSPGPTEAGKKVWLEYNALKAIHEHFETLDNPDFGTIRVLDYIQSPQTIIMEENRDPTLRSLFVKTNRLSDLLGKAPDLHQTLFNTGAWLKAYSALPNAEYAVTRLSRREDFNDTITLLTDYLGRVSGDSAFFQEVAARTIAAANGFMPDSLPMGIGHGDYAMRNLLVGANDRITAFDTCAKWRVPIYEDIAYFLVQLETNGLQIVTQGLAIGKKTLAAYQRDFLAGYFGDTDVPISLIRLFQVQLLLDSWASQFSSQTQKRKGIHGAVKKLYFALLNRRYRSVMQSLLGEIATQPS